MTFSRLTLVAAMLMGCAGTGGLREKFQGQRSTLGYVQDSRDRPVSDVAIAEYKVIPEVPEITGVERTRSFILPLLFINNWSHYFRINLGKAGVEPTLEGFGSRTLARDLERAGAASRGGPPDLKVKVRVTELRSKATYRKAGYSYFILFLYGFGWSQSATGIESSIEADLILERAGKADTVQFSHEEKAAILSDRSGEALPELVVNAMVETLSLCFQRMHARVLAEAARSR
jgi:hypothetical protein